jgi:hypothetical protein
VPSKYGFEVRSVGLLTNIVVNSAEFDNEHVGNFLQSGLIVVSSEHGKEIQSVQVIANIPVGSAEFFHETLSTSFTSGAPPNSAEFDREFLSPDTTCVHNAAPASSEYGPEVASLAAAMGGVDVHSYERIYEIMGGLGGTNITVQSAEFDHELRPMFLHYGAPDSAEFDAEWGSLALAQINVATVVNAEFGHDINSAGLFGSDFDIGWEANSVAITQFSNSTTIVSFEIENEWGPAALTQAHFINNPVDQTTNIASLDCEFDTEIQSGSFPGVPEINGAEFGWETVNPRFRYFLKHPKTHRSRRVDVRV